MSVGSSVNYEEERPIPFTLKKYKKTKNVVKTAKIDMNLQKNRQHPGKNRYRLTYVSFYDKKNSLET